MLAGVVKQADGNASQSSLGWGAFFMAWFRL